MIRIANRAELIAMLQERLEREEYASAEERRDIEDQLKRERAKLRAIRRAA